MDKKEPEVPTEKTVPVKWNIPDSIISRYATNMTIQLIEDIFKISFFEAKPEIRTELSQPIQKEVQADCVASIVISPKKLETFVEVLNKQLVLYKATQLKKETTKE